MDNARSSDRDALQHRIDDVPQGVLPHIRMGFNLLSKAAPEVRGRFIEFAIQKMLQRESVNSEEAAPILNVSPSIVGDALAAVSLPVGATVDLDVTTEDFIQHARGKLFDVADSPAAEEVVAVAFSRKDQLRAAMDASSLANAVLPSFRGLWVEVDLRLKFSDDGALKDSVPIAVLYVDTDTQDPLSFQASRYDLGLMIEKLQKAAANMDRAATLALDRK